MLFLPQRVFRLNNQGKLSKHSFIMNIWLYNLRWLVPASLLLLCIVFNYANKYTESSRIFKGRLSKHIFMIINKVLMC